MNHWAVGPLNGAARAFILSSNPADILAQMQEGEVVSPVPANVAHGENTVILRADLQFDIVEANNG
ncbi:hypothetical protein [Sphingomonas sp.]|uniref:hypothetical protein n=1 Tax=Sphingomonas sp. TaxID=28214 RepID=UPI0035A84E9D